MRHLRVPDDVWEPALQRTKAEGTNITAVVVERLREYAQAPGPAKPRRRKAEDSDECQHPAARVHKGLCGACGQGVR